MIMRNLQLFLVCGSLERLDMSQQGTREVAMTFIRSRNQANIGDISIYVSSFSLLRDSYLVISLSLENPCLEKRSY